MSDGLLDAMKWSCFDRDSIDGRDPWDDDEITQIVKDIVGKRTAKQDYWDYAIPKCTCGAEKTYGKNTTHSNWCDKNK